jgi:hypothetical protein
VSGSLVLIVGNIGSCSMHSLSLSSNCRGLELEDNCSRRLWASGNDICFCNVCNFSLQVQCCVYEKGHIFSSLFFFFCFSFTGREGKIMI